MKKEETVPILAGIVVLGSIWGLLEAITFLGLLHSHWGDLFPYHLCPCFLMTAIFGSFIMGSALSIYKKPSILIGIGMMAALFCLLGVPFLPIPVRSVFYGPVVASATAAVAGSISVALFAGFFMKKLDGSVLTRIMVGVLSAILASVLFIIATAYGVDKPICADLGYARPLPDFLGMGGMVWMVAAAIILPIGYLTGAKLQSWLVLRLTNRASLVYVYSATTVALCLGISTVAFMAGL